MATQRVASVGLGGRAQAGHRTQQAKQAGPVALADAAAGESSAPEEGMVDDPAVRNPLERLERLGTRWFGALLDWDGVLVRARGAVHAEAWNRLADEEGIRRPTHVAIDRAVGMKAEQAIEEALYWTRAPVDVQRLAQRKEGLTAEVESEQGCPLEVSESAAQFVRMLQTQHVPCGVCCTESEERMLSALERSGIDQSHFDALVSASDVARCSPDPEQYLLCASQMSRPPVRCVIFGSGNNAIEAANDCNMKCVALATKKPMYELASADLVAPSFKDVSFRNLQQLFAEEDEELAKLQTQMEPEVLNEIRGRTPADELQDEDQPPPPGPGDYFFL